MWPADPSRRKWTIEQLQEALKRESQISIGQEVTIAAYREIAIGISRRFLRGATAFKADEGDENEASDEEHAGASIADEQAGHTAHIAGLIYARGIMEMAGAGRSATSGSGRRLRARQRRRRWTDGRG
jgi:hypothetical protein